MRELDDIFAALSRSDFRGRPRLDRRDAAYLREKTLSVVMRHAREFVAERLSPAAPTSDGRQTPMRGHPVFPAQHATATCCRGCLAKWHHIAQGTELTRDQIEHVLQAIERWLSQQPPPEGTAEIPRETQELLFPIE
jgi:predicted Fe-S protein YdhL (DUF1289 family)